MPVKPPPKPLPKPPTKSMAIPSNNPRGIDARLIEAAAPGAMRGQDGTAPPGERSDGTDPPAGRGAPDGSGGGSGARSATGPGSGPTAEAAPEIGPDPDTKSRADIGPDTGPDTGPETGPEAASETGARIRARRLDRGQRQADLAAQVGISPAYLNLIEHGKRRIGGKVLVALARALDVEPHSLTEGPPPRLSAALRQAAARRVQSPLAGDAAKTGADAPGRARADPHPETDQIDALAQRFPGWSALICAQADEIEALEAAFTGLQNRLRHDPALAETMHAVLSSATAIRSMADILASDQALEEAWRARFNRNLHEEAERLSEQATWLLSQLQETPEEDGPERELAAREGGDETAR